MKFFVISWINFYDNVLNSELIQAENEEKALHCALEKLILEPVNNSNCYEQVNEIVIKDKVSK
jgi:hypothetical protein